MQRKYVFLRRSWENNRRKIFVPVIGYRLMRAQYTTIAHAIGLTLSACATEHSEFHDKSAHAHLTEISILPSTDENIPHPKNCPLTLMLLTVPE
jgi:hypothetical protein